MSFSRAKITRFNENQGPNAAGAAGAVGNKADTPRSHIPKINKSYASTPRPADISNRPKAPMHRRAGRSLSPEPRGRKATSPGYTNNNGNSSKTCNFLNVVAAGGTADDTEFPELEISDAQRQQSSTYTSRQDSVVSKTSSSGIPMPTASKTNKPATRKPSRSQSAAPTSRPSPNRNTLEYQFLAKKKRFEQLRKDLELKQKPVVELFQSLVELKRKLEANGLVVPLDVVKLVDFGCDPQEPPPPSEGFILTTEQSAIANEKNTEYIRTLEGELDPVPMTFSELGKYLMATREKLIEQLVKIKNGEMDKEEANLEAFELETRQLNGLINDAIERQEIRVKRILAEAQALTEGNDLVAAHQVIKHLEYKLKEANSSLLEMTDELERTHQQLDDVKCEQLGEISTENNMLKDKIKSLETELQTKKKKIADNTQATKNYEVKIEALSKQVNELDKGKKDAENKVNEMNLAIRNLQTKMKNTEMKWRDEKDEILKNHKGEHAILEKLTSERQALDTRVHLMNTILDEQKRTNEEDKTKLKKEIIVLKENLQTANVEKQILEDKLETMKQEVSQLTIQQNQAIELMRNSIAEDEGKRAEDICISEREAQLRTELVAMKVALKAAQERIEKYTTEKIRFMDNIERMNGSENHNKETLGKALVQKEERLTVLEREKSEAYKVIEQQNVKISQLAAKIENLQAGVAINHLDSVPRDTNEIKAMLEEGKAKLQKALAKSLDNEQKLIKYEHDINQKNKQMNDMENLLKVRDGLIGMLKAKKDELLLENDSLHKYSEEVRQLLFDTKEELKQKCDHIRDLTNNLDSKGHLCVKLEKKIKDLEATLSDTNEKRFKLQESIGSMEKELQNQKAAQMTNMAPDVHPRARHKFLRPW